MYDLEDVEVLRGEGYRKIAHAKYSAWTHRIMAKVWGQYRAEGVQIYPGAGLHGKAGRVVAARALALPRRRFERREGARRRHAQALRNGGNRAASRFPRSARREWRLPGDGRIERTERRRRPLAARRRRQARGPREHLHGVRAAGAGRVPKTK
jgi:hypothetical protein